jgi:hypothetical protein
MVGDGHAMGVATQIQEHKLWATEGWFQIDDPVFSVEGSQPGGKDLWLGEEGEVSVETESAVAEGLLERVDKLSAKDLTQHLAGKKVPLGSNHPVGVTLLETLETIPSKLQRKEELRFPAQTVIRPNQDFRGYAGQYLENSGFPETVHRRNQSRAMVYSAALQIPWQLRSPIWYPLFSRAHLY